LKSRLCGSFNAARNPSRDRRHFRSAEQGRSGYSGKDLAHFEASWKLQYLVQRAIEIISEASRAIPDDLKALRPEIPWNSVKGIGNVLRHEYRGISNPLIWRVVTDELPRLRIAVKAIRDADLTRFD
jgi:uncharacterized protein with HEPN domain